MQLPTNYGFWAVQRPLGSMFAVLWYEMSYENVLRRFGDFCIVVEAVLCTAQRLNINPCFLMFDTFSIDQSPEIAGKLNNHVLDYK